MPMFIDRKSVKDFNAFSFILILSIKHRTFWWNEHIEFQSKRIHTPNNGFGRWMSDNLYNEAQFHFINFCHDFGHSKIEPSSWLLSKWGINNETVQMHHMLHLFIMTQSRWTNTEKRIARCEFDKKISFNLSSDLMVFCGLNSKNS